MPSEKDLAGRKIPRKLLQKELSNERNYERVNLARKSSKMMTKMQGNVKLELSNEVEEIIPRLANFPMQGKTI